MKTRTDFATALEMILDILKTGEPYSMSKLAKEANLNFRTVKKILHVLESSQSSFSGKHLDVSNLDNLTVVKMKEKTGMTLFPEHIQNLIIKTSHYPTVSREEEILTHILLKNATNPDSAIDLLEDNILKELVEAEHVGKINDKYYLTEDGRYIAKGALKLYPELKETVLKPSNEERYVKYKLIQWQRMQPPNISLAKQKIEVLITT